MPVKSLFIESSESAAGANEVSHFCRSSSRGRIGRPSRNRWPPTSKPLELDVSSSPCDSDF